MEDQLTLSINHNGGMDTVYHPLLKALIILVFIGLGLLMILPSHPAKQEPPIHIVK